MNHESNRPIGVEDLLRLKRAERPPPEFWSEFDRQLRAKQLAAIVAKRPWWHRLSGAWQILPRYSLPIGAATVLMVTYISVRPDRATATKSAHQNAVTGTAVTATTAMRTGIPVSRPAQDPIAAATVDHDVTSTAVGADETSPATTHATMASGEVSTVIPLIGPIGVDAANGNNDPASSMTLAAAHTPMAAAPMTATLLRTGATLDQRQAVRQAIEPLQQITPPSERLRARLLTAMVSVQSADSAARATGTRAATQISEENLYDTSHRFGARGAGVMMKF